MFNTRQKKKKKTGRNLQKNSTILNPVTVLTERNLDLTLLGSHDGKNMLIKAELNSVKVKVSRRRTRINLIRNN